MKYSNYPYADGASYFNKYDYLPCVATCLGVRISSLEISLYNPEFMKVFSNR